MDDIFGSYYTQSKGFKVVYNKASVYQDRNNHNLTTDFENEILGYKYLPFILEDVKTNLEKVISEKSVQVFRQYTKEFQ
jgi:hypothetical protein